MKKNTEVFKSHEITETSKHKIEMYDIFITKSIAIGHSANHHIMM
jgi:hypothetical protein